MRKSVLTLFVLMFACISFSAMAQCNADLYTERCLKSLKPGFIFEKSYRVDGKDGQRSTIPYTCYLSKDTNYQFTLASKDGNADGMVFTLYDSRGNQVASNVVNDKFFASIEYKCQSTGMYNVTFTWKNSKTYCGAAVLGFKN